MCLTSSTTPVWGSVGHPGLLCSSAVCSGLPSLSVSNQGRACGGSEQAVRMRASAFVRLVRTAHSGSRCIAASALQ